MTSGSEITGVPSARRPPLEHLEHPVGHEPAADDVGRREHHRDEADRLRERVVRVAEHDDRTDDHDPVDEVRARHERRVQHRRHLRDHLEAEEDREDEDRQLDHEPEIGHAATSSTARVTQAPAVISSVKSSASVPPGARCSRSAETFRA